MDFTYFIQYKRFIEPAEKSGLYIVSQSHLPGQFQAFRCGLAGKPVDSATQFKSEPGNFASRFAKYLNYWLPTDGKVHAILTVPRQSSLTGFTTKVMPQRQPGDNRPDYAIAQGAKTLIEIREKQFHQLLIRYGMMRLGMPGTLDANKRSEFFKGSLSTAIRALKSVGVGDLYTFGGNNTLQITKQTLKRGDEIDTSQVALRTSPRLIVSSKIADALQAGDGPTSRAIQRLGQITPTASAAQPLIFQASTNTVNQASRDRRVTRAMSRLQQVRRRSPRLAAIV